MGDILLTLVQERHRGDIRTAADKLCRFAAVLILLPIVLAACRREPGPAADTTPSRIAAPSASDSPDGRSDRSVAIVARLDGRTVMLAELRSYIDSARGSGYRPATESEATRLLRGLMETILAAEPGAEGAAKAQRSSLRNHHLEVERDTLMELVDTEIAGRPQAPPLPPGFSGTGAVP